STLQLPCGASAAQFDPWRLFHRLNIKDVKGSSLLLLGDINLYFGLVDARFRKELHRDYTWELIME
ncbi:unnamed protein product, partial [Ilex paraguariensis]